ncbi:ABC transporter ATP-binding protein [Actinomadura nitritigenes]|uniref:ABC transporter ATP-binding protein n=1 Tax=Actinomadura nitritigenes TaxID=134602 RepID=UPI003D8CDC78
MTGDEPLLAIADLRCAIETPAGTVRALEGVDLTLRRGQVLGLVGESGSGKSMLVRSVMGMRPARSTLTGRIAIDGEDLLGMPPKAASRLRGRRVGMVFQDPMTALNPVVRVGRQITEVARRTLGLNARQARERAVELLTQVGIPEPAERIGHYPHQFSGGMRQRITIAMALACDPDLLIADEATTALDVTVQRQILDLLQGLQQERGMAMILVSHDMGVVAGRADEVAVMYAGRIVEQAATGDLFTGHRHRYTEALLDAVPRLDHPRHTRLRSIAGLPPDPTRANQGCPFAPRCPSAADRCLAEEPALVEERPGHRHACWVPVEIEEPVG